MVESRLESEKKKIAWEEICKPKHEGGLGLKSLQEANKVSCMKLIWRIVSSQQTLLVLWIMKVNIRKGTLWSVKGSTTVGSWMWITGQVWIDCKRLQVAEGTSIWRP